LLRPCFFVRKGKRRGILRTPHFDKQGKGKEERGGLGRKGKGVDFFMSPRGKKKEGGEPHALAQGARRRKGGGRERGNSHKREKGKGERGKGVHPLQMRSRLSLKKGRGKKEKKGEKK